jgi:hypothetical protein
MYKAFDFLTKKLNKCEIYDKSSILLKLNAWYSGQFRGDK